MIDFSEKDIEDALAKDISTLSNCRIWQQPRLPMGVPDIVYIRRTPDGQDPVVIVEIKKGKIDDHAFTQLLGYMGQIKEMIREAADNNSRYNPAYSTSRVLNVYGMLVGSDIAPMAARAVSGMTGLMYTPYTFGEDGFSFDYDAYWPELNQWEMNPELSTEIKRLAIEHKNWIYRQTMSFYNEGWRDARGLR